MKDKVKKIISIYLMSILILSCSITSYASSFTWDDDYKERAWAAYILTNWTSMQDELIFDTITNSVSNSNLSSQIEKLEDEVETVLSGMTDTSKNAKTEYTALILAIIEIVNEDYSSGIFSSAYPDNDPCRVLDYIYPNYTEIYGREMTVELSIEILAKKIFLAESASEDGNLYSLDDYLKSIVQGAYSTASYVEEYQEYTEENAQTYYNNNYDTVFYKYSEDFPLDVGSKLSTYYNALSIGSGDYIHFLQYDSRWSSLTLINGKTIGKSGCAACCAAMVWAMLSNDAIMTPATFLTQYEGTVFSNGLLKRTGFADAVSSTFGYTTKVSYGNLDYSYIYNGGMILANGSYGDLGIFNSSTHWVLVVAIEGDRVHILDPASLTRTWSEVGGYNTTGYDMTAFANDVDEGWIGIEP